jgi:hypothetical protein
LSRGYDEIEFNSPYADGVKIVPIQKEYTNLRTWITNEVRIDTVFTSIFARSGSQRETLAIMADTDNTADITCAHLDYIRVESKDWLH